LEGWGRAEGRDSREGSWRWRPALPVWFSRVELLAPDFDRPADGVVGGVDRACVGWLEPGPFRRAARDTANGVVLKSAPEARALVRDPALTVQQAAQPPALWRIRHARAAELTVLSISGGVSGLEDGDEC
jgi:hypothetical protein